MRLRSEEILAAENRDLEKLLASLGPAVELPAAVAAEASHPSPTVREEKTNGHHCEQDCA